MTRSLPKRLILLALVLPAGALVAQVTTTSRRPRELARPPQPVVYDITRRRTVPARSPKKTSVSTHCYVNTDSVGFYTTVCPSSEAIDWGVLGGTMTTKCAGLSPIVSSIVFGYGTSALDPSLGGPGAALTLTFYEGYQGFGGDSGNCPVASFAFTGLPGFSGSSTQAGTSYTVHVDLTGGNEFCLPDGRFGFGYSADVISGPLMCLTSDGAGGLEPCTGNQDAFDVWLPDTKGVHSGTFFFSGSDFSSWYAQIARADLSSLPSTVAIRNASPNPPNSLTCTAPVLGETLTATITAPLGYLSAVCFAFDSPVQLPLGGGQVLLCLDLGGNGELLSGAGLAADPVAPGPGGEPRFELEVPLPKNLDYCGFTFCIQALCAFGVTPFALTSACDLTLGG